MRGAGTFDELRAKRERVLAFCPPSARARILGRPPVLPAAKSHRIEVDLKTGQRTVESDVIIVEPPVAVVENPFVKRATCVDPAMFHRIIDAVAATWEVDRRGILSPAKLQRFTLPRFACYRLVHEHLVDWSLPRIGRAFKRDHTTCLSGLKRAAELLASDEEWRDRYLAAELRLKELDRP